MDWIRGETIGYGSFATVSLVKQSKRSVFSSSAMVVKSANIVNSAFLKKEKAILDQLGSFPQIVRCFGDDFTTENGERLYNVFLEYASRGSLADQMKKNGGVLPETYVRRHARAILRGLCHIHGKGFVHLDIKPQNLLVFDNGDVKIADFGLAKKAGEPVKRSNGENGVEFRGTPLYMAPESVDDNEYESPADIWALGCAIVEIFSGKPAWDSKQGSSVLALLVRIGVGDELPAIPEGLSQEGKDFLRKIFVKDPRKRWTADMLLHHPFVADEERVESSYRDELSTSPRGPFDFPDWILDKSSSSQSHFPANSSFSSTLSSLAPLVRNRIRGLTSIQEANWSDSESWVTVRCRKALSSD